MKTINRSVMRWCVLGLAALLLAGDIGGAADDTQAEESKVFRVGFGKRDITPEAMLPMWGYGARHSLPAQGTLDPLYAKAIVVHAGDAKVAIVGLDIGRGPTEPMMEQIRGEIAERAGIEHVMISGSHSHHGPVIELTDREGYGKGKYDEAVAYAKKLPELIVEAIVEADESAQPARMGVSKTSELDMNRNRHTKRDPKVTDSMLAVIRFDDEAGKPIAVLVNFAAHPVMTEAADLRYSADYPGFMQNKVEGEMDTNCVFMQGASGDLSPNPGEHRGPKAFGEAMAGHVIELARAAEVKEPANPSVDGRVDRFLFGSRVNFSDPVTVLAYQVAFFPELVRNFVENMKDGVPAELNTVLLNGEIALVGGSGEFFCNHSNRLKERSYVSHTLFFGYCNGHQLYFPTIEAASEGGYGADPRVSPVELGAGEQMMNQALVNIYSMLGKFDSDWRPPASEAEDVEAVDAGGR